MKIDVSIRPDFNIRFTKKTVDFLIAEAASHYDGSCKRLAGPDGLLTTVKRILDNHPCPEYGYSVTFRDIDLLSKVVEMSNDPIAAEIWVVIGQAVSHYNRNCVVFPEATVESNPA